MVISISLSNEEREMNNKETVKKDGLKSKMYRLPTRIKIILMDVYLLR